MSRIIAWGDGEYYKKYKDNLPYKIDIVITRDTKSDFKVKDNDILIIMSISSYGVIFNDAL